MIDRGDTPKSLDFCTGPPWVANTHSAYSLGGPVTIKLGGRSPSSFLRLIDALANENIWFEIECRVELLIVVSFDVRLLC